MGQPLSTSGSTGRQVIHLPSPFPPFHHPHHDGSQAQHVQHVGGVVDALVEDHHESILPVKKQVGGVVESLAAHVEAAAQSGKGVHEEHGAARFVDQHPRGVGDMNRRGSLKGFRASGFQGFRVPRLSHTAGR